MNQDENSDFENLAGHVALSKGFNKYTNEWSKEASEEGIDRVIPTRDPEDVSHDFDNALLEKMFKLRKKIPADIVEEIEAKSVEDLHVRIVKSEKILHDVEVAREADSDLRCLKDKVKDVQAPYSEAKKLQSSIIRYCTCLLEQKGK